MKLSVSIVTYHTDSAELCRCLDSLSSPVVEAIYIIDNGSEQRIADIAARYPNAHYTPSRNIGYGSAHNIALRKAISTCSQYHLVLNSDVEFQPDVLPRLLDVMDSRPEVGQLQPRITNPDGSLQYTVRQLPTPFIVFGRRFLPEALIRRRNDRYLLRHINHDHEFNVPYHQGSFMLLRTSALIKTGLFDERFFMYPEDIDLTRRIHRHYVTLYYPGETVIHNHRRESYKSFRLLRIHIVNMIRYFNKWGWFCDPERTAANRALDSLADS